MCENRSWESFMHTNNMETRHISQRSRKEMHRVRAVCERRSWDGRRWVITSGID